MGHSRPNYDSAISTFCWAIANDKEYVVNNRNTELDVLYIDDLVEGMINLLEGKVIHCEYYGIEPVIREDGKYCCITDTYKVTLGEIVDLLEQFIVVHGHGLIEERNINTGEKISFEVSGEKIEAVYMIPGWTHNIINLSDTEDLITIMTCNENFNIEHPDTFSEDV